MDPTWLMKLRQPTLVDYFSKMPSGTIPIALTVTVAPLTVSNVTVKVVKPEEAGIEKKGLLVYSFMITNSLQDIHKHILLSSSTECLTGSGTVGYQYPLIGRVE